MHFQTFSPHPLLKPYVFAIWDYDDLLRGAERNLSILPDTATYLCFLYQDELTTAHAGRLYTTRSGLAGFQSFRSDLGGSGRVSGVSARLTPWGLNLFCRGVTADCADRRVDCRDLFPPFEVERLEDALAAQPDAASRVRCVEAFLLARLDAHRLDGSVLHACRSIDAAGGQGSIADVSRELGWSERTLERRFRQQVGVSPKRYARVVRLRRVLQQRARHSSWAEAALAAGYFDQSHMINECRRFYGLSPEAVHAQAAASATFRFSGLLSLPSVAS